MDEDPKLELTTIEQEPVVAEPTADSTGTRSILTEEEIEAARKKGRDRLTKAMKEAEIERIAAEEMDKIRREEGKRTGRPDRDELVRVTIDVAEYADRLVINGTEYHHGYSYDVPRHVYESMRETMYRTHLLQNSLDGKDLEAFYRGRDRFGKPSEGVLLSGRGL